MNSSTDPTQLTEPGQHEFHDFPVAKLKEILNWLVASGSIQQVESVRVRRTKVVLVLNNRLPMPKILRMFNAIPCFGVRKYWHKKEDVAETAIIFHLNRAAQTVASSRKEQEAKKFAAAQALVAQAGGKADGNSN